MFSDLRKRKLTRFFNVLDRDGDGTITSADPEMVITNLASIRKLSPGMPKYDTFRAGFLAYWDDLMKRSDANDDGVVTLDEWLAYHEQMLADEQKFEYTVAFSAGIMFALMDVDDDGKITLEEYGEWMKAWGMNAESLSADIFAKLDRNGDGTLSQSEVLALTHEFYYSEDPDAPGNWAMGQY